MPKPPRKLFNVLIGEDATAPPPSETFHILLESGDAIILEIGDYLLLEAA